MLDPATFSFSRKNISSSNGTNILSFFSICPMPSKNCILTRLLCASMEFFINSTTATAADVIRSLPKCSIILGLTFIFTLFIYIPAFLKVISYFPCYFQSHQIWDPISNHFKLCTQTYIRG